MTAEQLKLESDEAILRTVRKHWFILFSKTFGIVMVGILPFVLLVFWFSSDAVADVVSGSHIATRVISFGIGAWLLIVWMALFGVLTDYYLDMWLITNKRIIAIDQQGFFHRSVASFRFERLQNVTVEIRGLIATLLDFGRIEADTAGHTDSFIINGVPNPRDIKAMIQEHADQVTQPPYPPKAPIPEPLP